MSCFDDFDGHDPYDVFDPYDDLDDFDGHDPFDIFSPDGDLDDFDGHDPFDIFSPDGDLDDFDGHDPFDIFSPDGDLDDFDGHDPYDIFSPDGDLYDFDINDLDDTASGDMFCFDELGDALNEVGSNYRNTLNKDNAKPNFDPKYLTGQSQRERAINAIIEIRAIWDFVTKDARYNYCKIYSKLSDPINDRIERECKRHKENFAVYDTQLRKWLIKPSEPRYEYCYNGKDFVQFKTAVNSVSKTNRYLLVGKYTILSQEPNFLAKTCNAPSGFDSFSLPTLKLIVGVPGCGKTTHILKNHRPGSLVLTSCAAGAQDVRARMAQLKNARDPGEFRRRYRTIDSYLLHSRDRYSTVWVDEAVMEHPGKLFLVCLFSGCRTLYMIGDPNQLGYINRISEINLLYDKASTFFSPTETLNVSYRCPVDVMAILSNKYEGGAFSTSEITRSMKCKKFTGLECVPKSKTTKYLVFKQAEKQVMKKANYDVSTIHEFQGQEADNVVIVRISRNLTEDLYRSLPHMLVGISRHKVSLVYYTPVDDDLKKLIETPLSAKQLMNTKKQNAVK